MFGLQCQYNLGNWYIYFYGYALLVLPLLKRGMLHDGIWRLIVAIVVFGGLATLFSSSSILSNCFRYSQVLAVGLYCAKTQVLSRWSKKITLKYVWIVLGLLAVVFRCGISGIKGFTTDTLAVPLVVITICFLFQGKENTCTFRILTQLGKCSTYMWFIHCIFFSVATRGVFQDMPIWINSVPIVFVIVTLISYAIAAMLIKSEKLLIKLKTTSFEERL